MTKSPAEIFTELTGGRSIFYAAINVEVGPPGHKHLQKSVGVDLGVKTLAVLSDGREFENQKLLRSELRKLRRLNRELSRRQEGSGRWNRAKRKLARFYRQIANRRLDYQHKMTTDCLSKIITFHACTSI